MMLSLQLCGIPDPVTCHSETGVTLGGLKPTGTAILGHVCSSSPRHPSPLLLLLLLARGSSQTRDPIHATAGTMPDPYPVAPQGNPNTCPLIIFFHLSPCDVKEGRVDISQQEIFFLGNQ